MELVSRMMDGSISYEFKNRFEPVLSGSGAQRTVEIELQEIPLFEGCSEGTSEEYSHGPARSP